MKITHKFCYYIEKIKNNKEMWFVQNKNRPTNLTT